MCTMFLKMGMHRRGELRAAGGIFRGATFAHAESREEANDSMQIVRERYQLLVAPLLFRTWSRSLYTCNCDNKPHSHRVREKKREKEGEREKERTRTRDISTAKCHLIPSCCTFDRAIVPHFHLSVYFTFVVFDDQYCARPDRECRTEARRKPTSMYIKSVIHYGCSPRKIASIHHCSQRSPASAVIRRFN